MMEMQTIIAGLMVLLAAGCGGVDFQESPLCCLANQWSVKMVHSYLKTNRGNFEYGEVLSNWTYDASNEREVYETTRLDNLGPQEQLVYYLLFRENTMYVYNNRTEMCIKQTLNKPFYRRCVPASAIVVNSNVTFGTGSKTINATRVKFHYPLRYGNTLFMSLTFSQNCIPLVEKFTIFPWGAGGMTTETVEYTDMKIGRVPDSLFELPRPCCKAVFARPERYPSISFDF